MAFVAIIEFHYMTKDASVENDVIFAHQVELYMQKRKKHYKLVKSIRIYPLEKLKEKAEI